MPGSTLPKSQVLGGSQWLPYGGRKQSRNRRCTACFAPLFWLHSSWNGVYRSHGLWQLLYGCNEKKAGRGGLEPRMSSAMETILHWTERTATILSDCINPATPCIPQGSTDGTNPALFGPSYTARTCPHQ